MSPKINLEFCIGCGICAFICPERVLKIEKEHVLTIEREYAVATHPNGCTNCGECVKECPAKAIILI